MSLNRNDPNAEALMREGEEARKTLEKRQNDRQKLVKEGRQRLGKKQEQRNKEQEKLTKLYIKEGKKAVKAKEKQGKDKEVKKPDTKAKPAKTIKKPVTRLQAVQRITQYEADSFLSLPWLMRLLVAVTVWNWIQNRRRQNEALEDYDDAVRYLRESRGFRH